MPENNQPKPAEVSKALSPKAPVKDRQEAIQAIAKNLQSKEFLALIMRSVMALQPNLVQADVIKDIADSLNNNQETALVAQNLIDQGIGNADSIKEDTGKDIAANNLQNQGMPPQQARQAVDASEPAHPTAPAAAPEAGRKQAQDVESAGAGAEGAEMPQPEQITPEEEGNKADELRRQQQQAKEKPEEPEKEEAKPEIERPAEEGAEPTAETPAEQPAEVPGEAKQPASAEAPAGEPAEAPAEGEQPAETEEPTGVEEEPATTEPAEGEPEETVEPTAEPEAAADLGAEQIAAEGAVEAVGEEAVAGAIEAGGEAVVEAGVGFGGWIVLIVIIILMLIPGVMVLAGLAMLAFNNWISKILTDMIMQLLGVAAKIPGGDKIAGKLGLNKVKKEMQGYVGIVVYAIGIVLLILGGAYLAVIAHLGDMSVWDWAWAWVKSL